MKSVSYDAKYDEKAGRVELFIRFFWAIPSVIVMMVLGLVAEICFVLQFLHILILGKRNEFMFTWTKKYISFYTKFFSYLTLVTEERSPIMPED
jgi:hypothetical protein